MVDVKDFNKMAVQRFYLSCLLIVAWVGWGTATFGQSPDRFTFSQPHLGTIIELTIYASDEAAANEAAQAAFARVRQLDLIFSDYRPDSEAMRLCEQAGLGHATTVSRELFDVLRLSKELSERTNGAFDVTIGPLVQLWRRARKEKRLPADDEIRIAKDLVDWKSIVLSDADRTIFLKKRGMRLDFGGIAKGYIGHEVRDLLKEKGCPRSLVAVAGDITAGESPPGKSGWKVAIAPLSRESQSRSVILENNSISTSGDAYQFVEIAGKRYSHIVDPQTGLGLTQRSSVTVIAKQGAIADAYATAICVMGPERGLAILETIPDVVAFISVSTQDGLTTFESKSFPK